MKESITNILALFGAITVLISIGFLVFMTVVAMKEHVKDEKRRRKREYEITHRFERKPLARCHCVDIVRDSDLKTMFSSEKQSSAICGDSIWLLMTTAFVTELILESEGGFIWG